MTESFCSSFVLPELLAKGNYQNGCGQIKFYHDHEIGLGCSHVDVAQVCVIVFVGRERMSSSILCNHARLNAHSLSQKPRRDGALFFPRLVSFHSSSLLNVWHVVTRFSRRAHLSHSHSHDWWRILPRLATGFFLQCLSSNKKEIKWNVLEEKRHWADDIAVMVLWRECEGAAMGSWKWKKRKMRR